MIRIKNRHIDQFLTPNHRVIHKNRQHSGEKLWISEWQIKEAKDLIYQEGLLFPLSAKYIGKNTIGEDLAELIGWILTDGSILKNDGNRITIYQSKKVGIKRIFYLLGNLGINYNIHSRKDKTNYTDNPKKRLYIRFSGEWGKKIRKIIPDKKLNAFLLHLKKNELKHLLSGIYGGDGSGQSIYGKPEEFRDALQILFLHLGYRTLWNEQKKSINFSNHQTTEMSRLCKKRIIKYPNIGIKNEKYTGIVWCVKTQNTTFIVRRNKKVFITGNSLGLEPNFELYIQHLCDIFDIIKKKLRKDGTCWVNIGDSYASGTRDTGEVDLSRLESKEAKSCKGWHLQPNRQLKNYPAKSLCCIPERFKIEMINRGWICRNTIIWYKRNCMPSSANDRFTVDFEYIYFFVKSRKYWFEQQFDDLSPETLPRMSRGVNINKWTFGADGQIPHNFSQPRPNIKNRKLAGTGYGGDGKELHSHSGYYDYDGTPRFNPQGKNKRCVWDIPTQPHPESHFAVFPDELCIIPIKSGCPEFICKKCGLPREKIAEIESVSTRLAVVRNTGKSGNIGDPNKQLHTRDPERHVRIGIKIKGYTDCGCKNPEYEPGIVLDPFMGTGTVLKIAQRLNRKSIGIDIKEDYVKIAVKKFKQEELFT